MAPVISLLNMKGGVGKTTLAVNLAWHFFHSGKNVLLVDLDPQFNATQYVMDFDEFDKHRKSKGTIADLFIDQPHLDLRGSKGKKKSAEDTIYKVEAGTSARFDLIPSELVLGWVVKNPAQMDFRLEKILTGLRPKYDYIFVDCAPTDSVLTTMALTASDFILVPIRPDRFSILGFANLLKTVEDFRNNCNDPHGVKTLGVVFTQVMGTNTVESECMAQIRLQAKKQKDYVFNSSLKYSTSFARSIKDQTPIFRTAYAHSGARKAAAEIAAEINSRIAVLGK